MVYGNIVLCVTVACAFGSALFVSCSGTVEEVCRIFLAATADQS